MYRKYIIYFVFTFLLPAIIMWVIIACLYFKGGNHE